jgi:CubicO group peptidase (beta-lactamase class C family)
VTRCLAPAPRRAARIVRTTWAAAWALVFLNAATVAAQSAAASAAARRRALIARGDSLQLPGSWTPPPGDPLAHHTAGFATTLCAAVFITGLDPQDAAANVGFFTGPLEFRHEVKDTVVDRATRTVRLTLENGVTRVARQYGSQGCVPLPIGEDSVHFTPEVVRPNLPPAASTPWPMGDVLPSKSFAAGLDSLAIAHAVDTIFGGPEAMTLAVVVTHEGRIIGERYAPGIGIHRPLESWSMGKSLTGTLVARLIQMGVYRLDQPAPIPEWQRLPNDPRRTIRIMDIMRMSSGLRIHAPQDPDYDPSLGYPDHLYFYTGSTDSYRWAATRPQQWKPNTVGRYRNVDPVLASYLVRLGAERLHQDYHAFPQRALFDRLGMRDAVIYTDPYGNFLGQGAEAVAARDWARLANLYLQNGVWKGERLLPRGYVGYVRTLAPAWVADGRPVYGGGFFWINGDGREPLPKDAYAMLGAGGQSAWIVPSHDLVIVRIGKYRGEAAGEAARRQGTALLMQLVPPSR